MEAELWPGLLADFAVRHRACAIVRGVRNTTDFDVEYQMALINPGGSTRSWRRCCCPPARRTALQLLHGPGDDPLSPLEKYLPASIVPLVREMTEKKEG